MPTETRRGPRRFNPANPPTEPVIGWTIKPKWARSPYPKTSPSVELALSQRGNFVDLQVMNPDSSMKSSRLSAATGVEGCLPGGLSVLRLDADLLDELIDALNEAQDLISYDG